MTRRSAIMLLLTLTLQGCQQTQTREEPLPPLRDVRGDVQPPINPAMPVGRALVNIQQIALSLEQPTDPAWEAVDEQAFPAVTRSVWNANGLRLGLIQRNRLRDMIEKLPPAASVGNERVLAGDHPVAVRRSPPLAGVVTVDLTIPPMAVQEEQITGGRAQLLLDVNAGQTLRLSPHHYLPQVSLLPRNVLEKELDGRIYHELALSAGLGPQDVLVLGLYRPWPLLLADPMRDEQDEAARNDASAKKVYDLSSPPPMVNNLGRALMTLDAANRPLQLILLITIEPLDGN
ncbi:MAG: hypothetical protein IT445_20120 [Phycisphaeraceae bacterium]|nr:hypothetical protein [Phycisphaeraceae bacterium]